MASEAHRELVTSCWLRKHGRAVRPHLRKEEKAMLQDCFELIDSDSSGQLEAAELQKVFEVD
jgi:Ca2+-binding EF-hand superfamily protein